MGCFSRRVNGNVTESSLLNIKVSAGDADVLTQIRTSTQRLKTNFLENLIFSVQLGNVEHRIRTEVSLYKVLGKDVLIKKVFGLQRRHLEFLIDY